MYKNPTISAFIYKRKVENSPVAGYTDFEASNGVSVYTNNKRDTSTWTTRLPNVIKQVAGLQREEALVVKEQMRKEAINELEITLIWQSKITTSWNLPGLGKAKNQNWNR